MDSVKVVALVNGAVKHFMFQADQLVSSQKLPDGGHHLQFKGCRYQGSPITFATFQNAQVVIGYMQESEKPEQ